MTDIQTLSLSEAKEVLSGVQEYRDLSKKLGNRGKALFRKRLDGSKTYVVEYHDIVGEELAWLQAQVVFEKSFGEKPKKEDVLFQESGAVKGGIKAYCDDLMVDLSFKKVEDRMQK